MNMKTIALAVLGFGMTSVSLAADPVPASVLSTDLDKLSYSVGVDLGKNFKRQSVDIKPDVMAQGMQDVLSGKTLLLTDDEMKEVVTKFQQQIMAKRAAEASKLALENKTKGEAFLADNKAKPGVVTLPSGLQYKILTKGTGPKPSKDDTVTVEYTGKLLDGSVFDSTAKSGGKPAELKLNQVIPGWTEALQLMPVGSTWEIYVPGGLAYGERSIGNLIGPNATLIFNIHLIGIKK